MLKDKTKRELRAEVKDLHRVVVFQAMELQAATGHGDSLHRYWKRAEAESNQVWEEADEHKARADRLQQEIDGYRETYEALQAQCAAAGERIRQLEDGIQDFLQADGGVGERIERQALADLTRGSHS